MLATFAGCNVPPAVTNFPTAKLTLFLLTTKPSLAKTSRGCTEREKGGKGGSPKVYGSELSDCLAKYPISHIGHRGNC